MISERMRLALYGGGSYLSLLADYICRESASRIEVRHFTDLRQLREAVGTGRVDVLLAERQEWEEIEDLHREGGVRIALLAGEKGESVEGIPLIFKYQPITSVLHELLPEMGAEKCHSAYSGTGKGGVMSFGVFAPFGGAGVTTYAIGLAKSLSKGNKTLYVGLEPFQSLCLTGGGRKPEKAVEKTGMSEIAFYLKQRKEKLVWKLEALAGDGESGGFLPAVEDYRDLLSLDREDMQYFLELLSQKTSYERFVFDVGILLDCTLYLLGQCQRIYLAKPKTEHQRKKQEGFFSLLKKEHLAEMMERMQQVDM